MTTYYRIAAIAIRVQMRRHQPFRLKVERHETIQEVLVRHFQAKLGAFDIWCDHGAGTMSDPYVFIIRNNKIDNSKVFVEVIDG